MVEKPLCGMSAFSHELSARQVPSVIMVQVAVQKLLSFWTAPSLIALSPCLSDPGEHRRAAEGKGAKRSGPVVRPKVDLRAILATATLLNARGLPGRGGSFN